MNSKVRVCLGQLVPIVFDFLTPGSSTNQQPEGRPMSMGEISVNGVTTGSSLLPSLLHSLIRAHLLALGKNAEPSDPCSAHLLLFRIQPGKR